MGLAARAAISVIAVLATAAPANAALVDMFGDGQLAISDIDARPNHLQVGFSNNAFVITDGKTKLQINGGSTTYCFYPPDTGGRKVKCKRPGRGEPRIQQIYAGGGHDMVRLADVIHVDDVFGGPGHDKLSGTPHKERLNGEDGDDVVVGGKGKDRLYGGSGDDTINARDNASDGLITCGDGRDQALIDNEDPNPIGCEIVRRR